MKDHRALFSTSSMEKLHLWEILVNPWHNHVSACVLNVAVVQRSSMVEICVSVRAVLSRKLLSNGIWSIASVVGVHVKREVT